MLEENRLEPADSNADDRDDGRCRPRGIPAFPCAGLIRFGVEVFDEGMATRERALHVIGEAEQRAGEKRAGKERILARDAMRYASAAEAAMPSAPQNPAKPRNIQATAEAVRVARRRMRRS